MRSWNGQGVNKTIVDCGLGDSTTIDRMRRRFLCGCFLDEAKIVSPGFQQPSSVSHPEALWLRKLHKTRWMRWTKANIYFHKLLAASWTCPKNGEFDFPSHILTNIDHFNQCFGGFWVPKNLDKPKSCSQVKSSWMAISWRFLGSWILVGPRRGNRGMPKSARTEGAETFFCVHAWTGFSLEEHFIALLA